MSDCSLAGLHCYQGPTVAEEQQNVISQHDSRHEHPVWQQSIINEQREKAAKDIHSIEILQLQVVSS